MRRHLVVLAAVPVQAREERLRRRSARPVPARHEGVSRTFEGFSGAIAADVEERLGPLEEEVGDRRVVLRREVERTAVVTGGSAECVERCGAIAGQCARPSNLLFESHVGAPARLHELEGGLPVVREHLGVVLGSAERLDPLGDSAVLCRALGARDLPVRDVPNEGMAERVLALVLDRRAPLAPDERLAFERVERRRGVLALSSERAAPEDLPDHGCVLEEILLGSLEAVEAGCDDALERRQREVLGRPVFEVELCELLA